MACGTAALLIRARAHTPAARLVGVDVDPHILALARKNIARQGVEIEIQEARAEDLPFPAASFEVVTSTLTFHHLPTEIKQRAMAEIYRVLKPGGRFLLADFGRSERVTVKALYTLGRLLHSRELRVWPQQKLLMIMNFRCSSVIHACPAGNDTIFPFDIKFYDLSDPVHPHFLWWKKANIVWTKHESQPSPVDTGSRLRCPRGGPGVFYRVVRRGWGS